MYRPNNYQNNPNIRPQYSNFQSSQPNYDIYGQQRQEPGLNMVVDNMPTCESFHVQQPKESGGLWLPNYAQSHCNPQPQPAAASMPVSRIRYPDWRPNYPLNDGASEQSDNTITSTICQYSNPFTCLPPATSNSVLSCPDDLNIHFFSSEGEQSGHMIVTPGSPIDSGDASSITSSSSPHQPYATPPSSQHPQIPEVFSIPETSSALETDSDRRAKNFDWIKRPSYHQTSTPSGQKILNFIKIRLNNNLNAEDFNSNIFVNLASSFFHFDKFCISIKSGYLTQRIINFDQTDMSKLFCPSS